MPASGARRGGGVHGRRGGSGAGAWVRDCVDAWWPSGVGCQADRDPHVGAEKIDHGQSNGSSLIFLGAEIRLMTSFSILRISERCVSSLNVSA